ncbi:MAG: hypothetical protein K1X74_07065 [Pirellulales bacterium]|nr:hypothetical protein [Pirellulales bacterium]
MPARILWAAMICAAIVAPATAEEFPYVAFVVADDVYVRGGPGENYYPTDRLARGAQVEVYRHDPGGWYAIRPPENSFSWVSGEFLEIKEDNLAVVKGDRVAARVGSMLGDQRDVIQVQLYRGEEVEILGAKRFGEGPNEQTWYQIAPPSGEFRWIAGRLVDRNPASVDQPRNRQAYKNRIIARLERGGDSPDDEALDELDGAPIVHGEDEPPQRSYAGTPGSRRVASRDRDFVVEPEPGDAVDLDRQPRTEEAPRRKRTSKRLSSVPADDFDTELTELELYLSLMVTEEPADWSLDEVRARAERAYSIATTALERGRARDLIARIQRFADLQQRARLVEAVDEQAQYAANDPAGTSVGSPRYDGQGRLARVKSSHAGAPAFALLDPNGVIRSFVTSAPGLNLGLYVGREVGVIGTIGYVPEFDKPHVTAKRVTILEQAPRR